MLDALKVIYFRLRKNAALTRGVYGAEGRALLTDHLPQPALLAKDAAVRVAAGRARAGGQKVFNIFIFFIIYIF